MRHHEETVNGYLASVSSRPEVLGVVVIGSVARGTPRGDSDVDLYLVVTDGAYADARSRGRIAGMSSDGVTYTGGYVDIKLACPHYLTTAIERADDATRASFVGARVVLDRIGELPGWIERIGVLPDDAWEQRIVSYRAQAQLYGGYFLEQADHQHDQFLVQHSSVHLAVAAGRLALAAHRQFFRGQKYLTAMLAELDLPDGYLAAWAQLVAAPDAVAGRRLLDEIEASFGPPAAVDDDLSRFITDNELAWLNRTIPPEFW